MAVPTGKKRFSGFALMFPMRHRLLLSGSRLPGIA